MFGYRPLSVFLVLAVCAASSFAGSPREELLRYVPDDVGFCLVVQNLRGQWRDLSSSPFARKWSETTLGKAITATAEWEKLRQAEKYVEKHLGVTSEKLLTEVFGDAFAFAYRPGPADKPETEQGIFLLRARDEKTLADLLVKLNTLQKQTGELKSLEEREHAGVKYIRRQEAHATSFYSLHGPVLLFSGQEAALKQAIEHEKRPESESSLLRRWRELKLDRAMVGLMVNPRAWDAAIATKPGDPAARMAARAWKALGGVGVGLHLESDLRLQVTIQMRSEELPASARRFLATASLPSELSSRIPENALLAISGRLDVAALYEFLGECLTRQAKQNLDTEVDRALSAALGRDVLKDLLPALGPNLCVWLAAPPREGKAWTPKIVAAIQLASRANPNDIGSGEEPIAETVLSAVRASAMVAILGHNKAHPDRPLRLLWNSSKSSPGGSVRGDGFFPPEVIPTLRLQDGYLVLASSPSDLEAFQKGKSATDAPLLRASLKEWRSYLSAKREPLTAALACKEGLTTDKASNKLDNIRSFLELFDRLELSQNTSPGTATFSLTLTPSAAFRK